MYELDEKFRQNMFDLLTKMFEIPARETALKIFNSIYFDPPGIFEQIPEQHKESILKFTSEIIEDAIHSSKKANQLQIYKFLNTLTSYLNKSEIANIGLKPSDNFIKSQLVLAMAHGITLTLCKEKFVYFADKVINELFSTDLIN